MTMTEVAIAQITRELQLTQRQVQATVELLDSGATVPFIARYRKEATGSLDEVAISDIRDRLSQLRELSTRREAVLTSLEERDLLTEELREAVLSADTMAPNGRPSRPPPFYVVTSVIPAHAVIGVRTRRTPGQSESGAHRTASNLGLA